MVQPFSNRTSWLRQSSNVSWRYLGAGTCWVLLGCAAAWRLMRIAWNRSNSHCLSVCSEETLYGVEIDLQSWRFIFLTPCNLFGSISFEPSPTGEFPFWATNWAPMERDDSSTQGGSTVHFWLSPTLELASCSTHMPLDFGGGFGLGPKGGLVDGHPGREGLKQPWNGDSKIFKEPKWGLLN